jgi:hypothetical protein
MKTNDDRNGVNSYRRPILRIYGSISALTQTAQKSTTSDNPGKEINMTGQGFVEPVGTPETVE